MRMRTFWVTTLAAAMVIAYQCRAGAQSAEQYGRARSSALAKMLADARALKLEDGKTVGDMLDSAKVAVACDRLLGGAEERQPARYNDTGDCRLVLRIQAKRLRANIEAIIKADAPDSKALAADSLPNPDDYAQAEGVAERLTPQGALPPTVYGPPGDLAGWLGVNAQDRLKVEKAALAAARGEIETQLFALLEGFPRADEVKGKITAIIASTLPESRMYMEGGIVEIKQIVSVAELMKAIRADNEKLPDDKKLLDAAQIEDLAKRLGDATITADACAATDGKPCDDARINKFSPLIASVLAIIAAGNKPLAPAQPAQPVSPPIEVEITPPEGGTR